MGDREQSYLKTIVEAASTRRCYDQVLADALKVCSLLLNGWRLDAAKHKVYVEDLRAVKK